MFRWFGKKGKEEVAETETIALSDLPEWLDRQETALREEEVGSVSRFREEFSGAVSEIGALIKGFGQYEDHGPVHPKLDKVTRDSLPLFSKAMNAHLSRKPPEDSWTKARGWPSGSCSTK